MVSVSVSQGRGDLEDQPARDTFNSVAPMYGFFTATALNRKIQLQWNSDWEITYDPDFKFEGYTLLQARTPWGPWRRVMNWDLVNSVDTIWERVFNPDIGQIQYIPVRFGTNNGIVHSFEITRDSLSGTRLYNQNTYYFRLEAYAYCATCTPKVLSSAASLQVTPEGFEPLQVNLAQWSVSDGGNGHWYAVLPLQLTWTNATTEVSRQINSGNRAHLASIESQQENEFVLHQILAGLSSPSISDGFWTAGKDSATAKWSWSTGEPFYYSNFASGMEHCSAESCAIAITGPLSESPLTSPGNWFSAPRYFPCEYCQWAVMEWDDLSPTISFDLPEPAQVEVEIVDILGRHIKWLSKDHLSAGRHTFVWQGVADDGMRVSSGVYMYRLTTPDYSASRKMLLLK